jgi:hypothetical protein
LKTVTALAVPTFLSTKAPIGEPIRLTESPASGVTLGLPASVVVAVVS